MRILFAIGIAVSALLLTSCSNPDTSGGVAVTMSRDNASEFPDGSCEGPREFTDELSTGCGWIYPNEKGYYIQPDASLRYADLRDADLYRADLSDADLSGANLYVANLSGADLIRANLRDANLYGAYLRGANLYGANLRDASLRYADLRDADLRWADLYGADLSRADLRDADLTGAYLYGADLSGVKADSSTICPSGMKWGTAGNNCGF